MDQNILRVFHGIPGILGGFGILLARIVGFRLNFQTEGTPSQLCRGFATRIQRFGRGIFRAFRRRCIEGCLELDVDVVNHNHGNRDNGKNRNDELYKGAVLLVHESNVDCFRFPALLIGCQADVLNEFPRRLCGHGLCRNCSLKRAANEGAIVNAVKHVFYGCGWCRIYCHIISP